MASWRSPVMSHPAIPFALSQHVFEKDLQYYAAHVTMLTPTGTETLVALTLTKAQKRQQAQIQRSAKARQQREKRDERILVLRDKGMTLEEIAEKIGITHQRVGQIINSKLRELA